MFYVKLSTHVLNVHTLQTFEYQINNRKSLQTSSEMAKLCLTFTHLRKGKRMYLYLV